MSFTSRVIPLPAENVDTDQIVPARFLKVTDKAGLGDALFRDWRFEADGSVKNPAFVLDKPEMAGRQILLAGDNFGCGSSREHAPWALEDYGFEAIVAPSYGDIFRQNSLKIGLLPVELPAGRVKELMARAQAGEELTVDLEARTAGGHPFELDDFSRECLLEGLDDVALTLLQEDALAAYEASHTAPISTLTI